MKGQPEMKLTQGSKYKIYSLGSREKMLESQGVFEGYIGVGLDEIGMIIKLQEPNKEEMTRVIPLHAILAIDIINAKPHDKNDDDQEIPHYVG
jgi:hypothetical protein